MSDRVTSQGASNTGSWKRLSMDSPARDSGGSVDTPDFVPPASRSVRV